jgi:subtilisin family serine protease
MKPLFILKASLMTVLMAFLVACGTVQQPTTAPTDGEVDLASSQRAQSGSVRAWSGGMRAWSGGMRAWSGGSGSVNSSGTVLVENTTIWNKLSLNVAHQVLAKKLGKDVVVAVIDTGVDYTHPIFKDRLTPRNTWYDFVSRDTNPQEVTGAAYGHGTVVASIVLQVAPDAKIMPLRVLDGNGSGDVRHVAAAIDRAVQRGAKVIQLSLGTEGPAPVIEQAVERAASAGVYVIASAGNSNSNPTYPAYTAMLETTVGNMAVGVGSVTINDVKSDFSNFAPEEGPIEDGLEMVSFGEDVYAAVPGSRIAAWDGTSMAAPMVAGAIALAIAEGAEALSPRTLALKVVESSLEIDTDGTTATGTAFELEQRLEIGLFLCSALNLQVAECQQAFADADDDDDDGDDDD